MANFTGQPISASYSRLLQIDGGVIQNGLGSTVSSATIGSLTGSFSGSLVGTATSASFATTASYALNAAAASSFPYTGSARITGSLLVTGSFNVSNSLSVSPNSFNINSNTVTIYGSTGIENNVDINASYALNARGQVSNYDNHTTLRLNVNTLKPNHVVILDRTAGSSRVELVFESIPSSPGCQYKFILPYSGSNYVDLEGDANNNLYGTLINDNKDVEIFRGANILRLNTPNGAVVNATFLETGGNSSDWWLEIFTSGSYTVTY